MTETIDSASAATSTVFLGHNGEWWDFWLIISVIFAALAAAAVGIATTGSIVSHKREAESAEKALEVFKLNTEKRVSDSNARAAEAISTAELERLERVKLEAKLAPRRLSSQQRDAIVSVLVNVPSPPTIAVVSRLLDAEGNDFADDIFDALVKAGWHAERFRNWTMGDKGLFVATFEGTTISSHDPTIEGITRALASAALDPKRLLVAANQNATMSPYFQQNVLYILVGTKQ
ncbi:hypothetical protein ACQR1H_04850 [Bradyrhizobium sp. HKCCYLRH2015]|uniref:hypothetical protein n=1 Tax=Bradyrhizobium sp. HKCCYLRH2015 TaxID=3420742 RepID=UPI003EBDC812